MYIVDRLLKAQMRMALQVVEEAWRNDDLDTYVVLRVSTRESMTF